MKTRIESSCVKSWERRTTPAPRHNHRTGGINGTSRRLRWPTMDKLHNIFPNANAFLFGQDAFAEVWRANMGRGCKRWKHSAKRHAGSMKPLHMLFHFQTGIPALR